MKIEDIMAALKSVKQVPQGPLRQKLVNACVCSDASIKRTFFNASPAANYLTYRASDGQPILRQFAVSYLTYAISTSTARSFNTTVHNISMANINQWFASHGPAVGFWLMVDYLNENTPLSALLADKEESLAAMRTSGNDPAFVNGFLVECDTAGSSIPAKLFLLLLNVLDPSGQTLQSVLPVWQASERWNTVQNYSAFNWLETVAPSFAQDTDAFNTVKGAVDQAISARTGPYSYTRREFIDSTPTGMPIYGNVTHQRYEYGEAVLNWLNQPDGPLAYQMRSSNAPNNFEEKRDDSSGCVRENTPIRMADGSVKLIQDIGPGDLVLNGHGTFSVCSTEKIYNPFVAEMYSINDEPVFLSPEHAFMTDRGWCSLDPLKSRKLNPEVMINRLEIGDRVWKFHGLADGGCSIEKITVERLQIERAEEEAFIGYDLHFSEGYHSYYARDYLCLLNYPEITIANVLANMRRNMNMGEQQQFVSLIREHDHLFRKIFGHEAMNHLHFSLTRIGGHL